MSDFQAAVHRKTRVLHVIATLDKAGAEGQLAALVTRLDELRYEARVVCLTRGGPYRDVIEESGVRCEVIGKRWKVDPWALLRLWRIIREYKPHILHTWMFTANAYGRLAGLLARVPALVVSERSTDKWKPVLYKLIDRLLARQTDVVVANAQAVKESVLKITRIPGIKVLYIPNGVDWKSFTPKKQKTVGDPVFCSIGRLAPPKRMDMFINALKNVRSRGINCKGIIAGKGPLSDELRRLTKLLQIDAHVCFRGHVDDVRQVFAQADIFVLASDWEGMPNVVLEAMAAALPVVATRVDGTSEVVVHGETGFLAPRGDERQMADFMARLANDPGLRVTLGNAGRERVKKHFSMERMVAAYEHLYDELCAKAGVHA